MNDAEAQATAEKLLYQMSRAQQVTFINRMILAHPQSACEEATRIVEEAKKR